MEDRVNTFGFGFLCFMLKANSHGESFMFLPKCELYPKGNVFNFCDNVSYCESEILRRNVFKYRLLFSTSPFDHGAYGARDQI